MRDPGAATIPSGKKREVHVASIDHDKCVGCGRCIAVCNQDAIRPDYDQAVEVLNYKIAEYTKAIVDGRPCFHISLAIDVSPNCDCHDENDKPIVGDIGFFASFDPVALDRGRGTLFRHFDEPPLDALIHRFKYGADLRLGRALALAMAQTMLPPLAIDVLLPVPLAPRRQRSRGFNQAAVLTRDLGAAWRLPVLLDAVQRRRETPHQARLHASARRENLRGAFAVERARAIAGRRVGVVDDVLTTGATLNALAEVLLESGAAAVQGIVLARAASPVRLTG